MARTLEQIIAELNPTYDPQVNSLRQRQELIPGQVAEEEKGLQAKQETAFGDILSGARRRGLGFSGIPLAEQAKYTSTDFLPALARLRQTGREQAMSLEDAINGIFERRNTLAQQLRQGDLDRDFQREQFEKQLAAQRAAAAGAFSPTFGGGGGGNNPTSATANQRADKGFQFTDAAGRPISAAAYAAAKGISFRSLLQQMANSGDQGARTALGFVGDDFGYDPRKVNNQNLANLYNSLVWGTGRQASARPTTPSFVVPAKGTTYAPGNNALTRGGLF